MALAANENKARLFYKKHIDKIQCEMQGGNHMKKNQNEGISFFQKYLSVWVILCMVIGVLLGH